MNLIEKYNLKVGDKIKCHPHDSSNEITGMIGEIDIDGQSFYLWNGTNSGSRGDLKPTKYKYSWQIETDQELIITKINTNIDCRKLNASLL